MADLPEAIQSVEPIVVPWPIPQAFAIAVAVGVVFVVFHARRATRVGPIQALRHQ